MVLWVSRDSTKMTYQRFFSLRGGFFGVVVDRPFQILLGNFLATFRILSNFFVTEQLLATFRKTSTFFGNFWAILNQNAE